MTRGVKIQMKADIVTFKARILIASLLMLKTTLSGDVLELHSGETIECTILKASKTELIVEPHATTAAPPSKARFQMSDIRRISVSKPVLGPGGELEAAPSMTSLSEIWELLHPVITRPGNTIALVGIQLSEMMLHSEPPSLPDKALEVLEFIKSNSCDSTHQIKAADTQLFALESLKRYDQASSEAAKFDGPFSPLPLQLRAKLTLGICGHEKMRLFVAENPRWPQDKRVQRERDLIYQRTLDLYAFTSLFGAESEHLAGRSLYQMARFHLLCDERADAERVYEQLFSRFQNSTYTRQLRDELNLVIQAQ